MKRIRDREKYLRHQRARARDEQARRVRKKHRRRQSGVTSERRFKKTPIGLDGVFACERLSVKNNAEHTIEFFDRLLRNLDKKRPTFVHLTAVTEIDYDAIVVMLSILIRFKEKNIKFHGDYPSNTQAKLKLTNSGFFQVLYKEHFQERNAYVLPEHHSLSTHANRNVDSALTARIVAHAAKSIWGAPYRLQGVQRVLLELMQNTNNHAAPARPGEKHWWLSMYHDRGTRTAYFAFVDLGVGVFGSLDSKTDVSKWFHWREKLASLFDRQDRSNAEVLRLIMRGELHRTVTGKEFRGKGLPGIRKAEERNWLSRLIAITNDVYADVSRDNYLTLQRKFRGTLVTWEISTANRYTP